MLMKLSSRLPVTVFFAVLTLAACSDSADRGDTPTGGAGDGGRIADHTRDPDAATHLGATTDAATNVGVGTTQDGGRSANDASLGSSDGGVLNHSDAAANVPVSAVAPVNLGAAGSYAVLAKTGISAVPPSLVTGDVGVSPAAGSYITGFSLIADATNVFATAAQITGKVYAADYASPTPANLTAAIGAVGLAYTDASGRAPDQTELGAGNIGGLTLKPGVYKWGSGLLIPTDVTLAGDASAVWIFQVAQGLTVSSGAKVVLVGGALPKNVFWSVAGTVDVGTTAHLQGVVLALTNITLRSGASIDGRLLAQTAVTLDASKVVEPAAH
jgi:hypothetical protein